jgi:3-oxoacyl-[acyl-carrier protein] reductase
MTAKRALVTGGTGSIGEAICRRLASDGMHVLVHTHRQVNRADEIVSEIRRTGGSAEAIQFDVTVPFATKQILEEALRGGDPIQVLVSNAGFHRDQPLAGMDDETWRSVIDVSLHGFFSVVRPLLLPMMKTRWGRIIAISSISALIGNRGQANYAAAKAGLHGAAKSLALEIATRGVTVNVVAPGIIESPETMVRFDSGAIEKLVPMKRAGRPEEVAALVAYLASDAASYMTGQILSINGGMA